MNCIFRLICICDTGICKQCIGRGRGVQICGVSIRTYFRSDKELSHLNIALSLRRIRVNLPQFEGSVHIWQYCPITAAKLRSVGLAEVNCGNPRVHSCGNSPADLRNLELPRHLNFAQILPKRPIGLGFHQNQKQSKSSKIIVLHPCKYFRATNYQRVASKRPYRPIEYFGLF